MKQRAIIIVIIGVVAVVVWLKREQQTKTAADATILADAIQIVSRVEGYEDHREYIDRLVERAHQQAFKIAYKRGSPGRRWTPAKPAFLEEDKYLQWLFINMRREIHSDIPDVPVPKGNEYRELQGALETLRKELGVKGLPGL